MDPHQSVKHQQASDWVHEYGDMLFHFALQRTQGEELAKDLVQETFLAAWRGYDQYRADASLKTWLFSILKNKIIDYHRKTKVRQPIADDAWEEVQPYFNKNEHWTREAGPKMWSQEHADTDIEKKEFHMILNACQSKLKDIQQTVFKLKYQEDMGSEEIINILDISTSNYWVIMHRAKLQLRACLEANWFENK